MSVLIKSSNGRLAIDPEVIFAIETGMNGQVVGSNYGFITLQNGGRIEAEQAELEEIRDQWEVYLENGPDDGHEEDEEEGNEFTRPVAIDITPGKGGRFKRPGRG